MRYTEAKKKILKLRKAGAYKFKGIEAYFIQKSEGIHHTRFNILPSELEDIQLEDMDYYIDDINKRLERDLKDYINSREWKKC